MYIIAEIGSVHDGSLGNAKKLVELAHASGADCAKFQIHIPEFETTPNAPNPSYFTGESRYDYFKRTGFNRAEWLEIIDLCSNKKIDFMASVFSIEAVNFLVDLGCKKIKIPSGEVNNIPLIEHIAQCSKDVPLEVFLSSGMSNLAEIECASNILSERNIKLTIFQCSSSYPCSTSEVGLNVIELFAKKYPQIDIGFSDHTENYAAAIGAVCFGAVVIEKHITFSRKMYGSDASLAMEPDEFKKYCAELRNMANILKNPVSKNDIQKYEVMRKVFTKSVYAKCDLRKDKLIEFEDLIFLKPGNGIPASEFKDLLGKKLTQNVRKLDQIKWEMVL